MGDLYDTLWTIQTVIEDQDALSKLFRDPSRALLEAQETRLSSNLRSQRKEGQDDLDDRTGTLRETSWRCIRLHQDRGKKDTIRIIIRYEKSVSTFLLLQSLPRSKTFLLLSKASVATTRQLTTYLGTTYDATIHPIQFSTQMLQRIAEQYIQALYRIDQNLIGVMKVTLSFSAPVAPSLKSLDLDVAAQSVIQLLEKADANKSSLFQELEYWIEERTGTRLHFQSTTEHHGNVPDEDSNTVIKLSKISCATTLISSEGRVRFTSKSIDDHSETVQDTNEEMLRDIARVTGDQIKT